MEDRETARMRKYGESETTRIMMATAPHVISGLGLRKFQADGFLLTRVYLPGIETILFCIPTCCAEPNTTTVNFTPCFVFRRDQEFNGRLRV